MVKKLLNRPLILSKRERKIHGLILRFLDHCNGLSEKLCAVSKQNHATIIVVQPDAEILFTSSLPKEKILNAKWVEGNCTALEEAKRKMSLNRKYKQHVCC